MICLLVYNITIIEFMEYIEKNELLNFNSNKKFNFQYYQWAQKKRVDKEKSQYEQFRKMWFQIQGEDEKEPVKYNSKSVKATQEKTIVKPTQTYVKNMLWKQNVDDKIERRRQQQKQEVDKFENQFIEKDKQKDKKVIRDSDHQGPIKAWKERFDYYLKTKCGQDNQELFENHFHPNIDRNSRKITSQMVGKVQDRLIYYGEKLKEKKAEMEANYQNQLFQNRNVGECQSIQSDSSQVFWRLYKDGEKMNKRKNFQKSEYSFTPEINQYSMEIASRINEKRKPLYPTKTVSNVQKKEEPIKKDKRNKQKSFEDFIKRNQALLSKIQKHKIKKIQLLKQKQNHEIKACTFTPNLNQKSLQMFSNRQPQCKFQNQNIIQNKYTSQIDSLHLDERKIIARSVVNESNTQQKQMKSTERIQRLNSDGNFLIKVNAIQICENDSISNDFRSEQCKFQQFDEPEEIKRSQFSRSRQYETDFLATDRIQQKTDIYNINEQFEEDSIQKQLDNQWENQLNKMEMQIQEMMARTNN